MSHSFNIYISRTDQDHNDIPYYTVLVYMLHDTKFKSERERERERVCVCV